MQHITNTITIQCAPAEVFAFLADFTHFPLWNYYVQRVDQETPGPVGLGTRYHQRRKSDEQHYEIVEWEPCRVVTVQTLPPAPHLRMRFAVQPDGTATRVVDTWEVTLGLPGIIERLAKGRVQRAVAANLAVLQRLLEDGAADLPDGRRVTYP